ncbi:MAG: RNA polymerase sigma-54 factor, partial [Planctomycetota bacterium]
MRLSLGQDLRLVQKQILAPRMIQSMEILQLPILALQERIEREMQENPVLELREDDPDLPEPEVDREVPDAPTEEERELVIDETHDNRDDFERLMKLGEEWPDTFEEHSRPSRNQVEEAGERKLDAMANMADRPQTLQDYLHDQLGWFDLEPELRAMADRIIYNLDPNGYLQGQLDDLLGPDATEDDKALAKRALTLVQRLDPPGVGARDLRECLLLQLIPGQPLYEELRTLILGHLEDLEHNRMPAITRKTGLSIDTIQEALGELRKLKPKP